jgi:hypothetical protein
MTPCGSSKGRRFGGTYRLCLQDTRKRNVPPKRLLLTRAIRRHIPVDSGLGSYKTIVIQNEHVFLMHCFFVVGGGSGFLQESRFSLGSSGERWDSTVRYTPQTSVALMLIYWYSRPFLYSCVTKAVNRSTKLLKSWGVCKLASHFMRTDWQVLSPLLGDTEIMHSLISPCCVVLSHYLQVYISGRNLTL